MNVAVKEVSSTLSGSQMMETTIDAKPEQYVSSDITTVISLTMKLFIGRRPIRPRRFSHCGRAPRW
jgi:hypothetical protein